ncbi:hypothetical protein Cfor_09079 [Coptotermes formosanus]|uniref:Uncharacterized protein n=1 Tax=Coptotermes formosanus TaxID=36987 RepID=A0A6L2P7Y9_COPFO|nr:hypothetical protein Cfor_09079 [Coptotermes formosanus]
MERWGVKRICACCGTAYSDGDVPSPNSICRWVRQWCEEGSVSCKKPPGQPSSVRTPENIAGVFASVGSSPRRSTPKHAPALGMSDRSVQHILHTALNLHPYKLQIVHSLSNWDKEVRLQFVVSFGDVPWPPCSLDLRTPDSFLWGYLESTA